jgi:hypothetical protein
MNRAIGVEVGDIGRTFSANFCADLPIAPQSSSPRFESGRTGPFPHLLAMIAFVMTNVRDAASQILFALSLAVS